MRLKCYRNIKIDLGAYSIKSVSRQLPYVRNRPKPTSISYRDTELIIFELRGPFVDKCLHTLFLVFCRKEGLESASFKEQAIR